jgi:hypothetical protein
VFAAFLLGACASDVPRSSAPRTQTPPPSTQETTDAASRRGQQGGEQAPQPGQSSQEEGNPAAETKTGSRADRPQSYKRRTQREAQPSDLESGSAQDHRQATKNGANGEQSGGSEASGAEAVSIGAYPGGPTSEERRQGLDRHLDRSLAKFDERLRREQAELDEEAARAAAQRAAQGGGGDIGRQEGLQRASAPPPPEEAGGGDRPDLAHGDPVPDGEDDDVVARQLREAAENEQDPELRKKLWEEYREYKENNG